MCVCVCVFKNINSIKFYTIIYFIHEYLKNRCIQRLYNNCINSNDLFELEFCLLNNPLSNES